MPGDAPEVPASDQNAPGETAPPPIEVEDVSSLTEIVEAAQEAPPRPEPIKLVWDLPPSEKHPRGRIQRLTIETRFPNDAWLLGIRFQTELKQKIRETKTDEKGNTVLAHPLADLEALCKEVVVRPTWLHNESALQKLKETMPSPTFAELRRKLMLTAGLDGDFFADYQRLTVPQTLLLSALESASGSGSTLPPSTPTGQGNSSPGPSTTGDAAPKPVESASPTTSGSSP